MTKTILDAIKEYKLIEIERDKKLISRNDIEELAKTASPVRKFCEAIKLAQQTGYGLIAEIKKASPSKGLIREDFNPEELAKAYEKGGATCLSVLTDKPSFMGDKAYLTSARSSSNLPTLRKDFMYDTYQVIEARALNADCILIIMASVSDQQAKELEHAATLWNMDVLIEVHDEIELERAMNLNSPMIGINNRNLKTFKTSTDTTKRLSQLLPSERLIISESGLFSNDDLRSMARVGVRSFLVGESLMRQDDVTEATQRILENPLRP